jgi:hypothetical protein
VRPELDRGPSDEVLLGVEWRMTGFDPAERILLVTAPFLSIRFQRFALHTRVPAAEQ